MLKTASTILLIGLLFGALFSALVIISPQAVVSSRFTDVPEFQSPIVANAYFDEARHLGAFAFATTVGALFILFVGFKKGQAWAWWALLAIGIFGWVYGFVRFLILGDTRNIVGFAIGIVLWLIGILLPIRAFFPKKPTAAPAS